MSKGDLGVLLATSYSHSELRPTIAQEEIGAKKLTERTLTVREANRSVGRRVWASIAAEPRSVACSVKKSAVSDSEADLLLRRLQKEGPVTLLSRTPILRCDAQGHARLPL